MKKNELREKYRKIRDNIEDRKVKDEIIFSKVINDENILDKDTILIYVSYKNEVDTINLISYFLKYKKVAVPKIINKEMEFYYINCFDDLRKGHFGILEPTTSKKVVDFTNSVSITPGICFDKNNYRVGYGGGYYDKFLAKYKVYSVGLCYEECLVEEINIDKYDIKMNKVITDQ